MGGALAIWQRPGVPSTQPTTIEALLERVVVCPSGCWPWAGGQSDGSGGAIYGRILRPGTRNAMAAHRYVFLTFKGPIPPGWHVDHICRQWATIPKLAGLCCNPDHLEAVPHRVNYARRDRDNGIDVDPAACLAPAPPRDLRSFEDFLCEAFDPETNFTPAPCGRRRCGLRAVVAFPHPARGAAAPSRGFEAGTPRVMVPGVGRLGAAARPAGHSLSAFGRAVRRLGRAVPARTAWRWCARRAWPRRPPGIFKRRDPGVSWRGEALIWHNPRRVPERGRGKPGPIRAGLSTAGLFVLKSRQPICERFAQMPDAKPGHRDAAPRAGNADPADRVWPLAATALAIVGYVLVHAWLLGGL